MQYEYCAEPTLLLGSYAIVVVFSNNIPANNKKLQNITVFRSKKMKPAKMTKSLVPFFMMPSLRTFF